MSENFLTKKNSSLQDWAGYNQQLFAVLRSEATGEKVGPFVPFNDADSYAEKNGISQAELLDRANQLSGSLGIYSLYLADSEMDGAKHIVLDLVTAAEEYPDQPKL